MAQIVPTTNSTFREAWRWGVVAIPLLLIIALALVSKAYDLHAAAYPSHAPNQTTAQTPEPESTPEPPTFVEKSHVLITTTWESGFMFYGKNGQQEIKAEVTTSCSGFFIEDNTLESATIATANHCVAEDRQVAGALREKLRVQVRTNPMALSLINSDELPIMRSVRVSQSSSTPGAVLDSTPMLAQVVGTKPEEDAAVLQLNLFKKEVPALQFADSSPEIGQKVWGCGFPGVVLSASDENSLSPSLKDGAVSSRQKRKDTGAAVTELSVAFGYGMSGGAVVDEQGHVVGIISYMVGAGQPFNFGTDTESTKRALESIVGS